MEEVSKSEKSKKHQCVLDSTRNKQHTVPTLDELTHCGMRPRTSHACRWMRDGASRALPRDKRGHVVTCMSTQSHEHARHTAPPPPARAITCAPTLHFPVCHRRLSPSCCQTPGHLWNSPRRSHLTPALSGTRQTMGDRCTWQPVGLIEDVPRWTVYGRVSLPVSASKNSSSLFILSD